jgi:hypothetical protein
MVAITVSKKWVESLGGLADTILILYPDVKEEECALLTAAKTNFIEGTSFVEAKLCRAPETITDKTGAFMVVKIPTQYVTAILEFAEDDPKKFGFAESSKQ